MSEDNNMPAINFIHKTTGTKVSSLWITGRKKLESDNGWKEIKTGEKDLKIMCYDEKL